IMHLARRFRVSGLKRIPLINARQPLRLENPCDLYALSSASLMEMSHPPFPVGIARRPEMRGHLKDPLLRPTHNVLIHALSQIQKDTGSVPEHSSHNTNRQSVRPLCAKWSRSSQRLLSLPNLYRVISAEITAGRPRAAGPELPMYQPIHSICV